MNMVFRHSRVAVALVLAFSFALVGVAQAQEAPPAQGLILGEVDQCVNGNELPAASVSVGIDGGSGSLARSDTNGQFFLALPPGQYTIVATGDDGSIANRQYVPVEASESLDIGILELGGGCGLDDFASAPALPTFTPAATAVVDVTATPEPTPPPPTATAVPTQAPDSQPTDQAAPDQSAPDQSGGSGG